MFFSKKKRVPKTILDSDHDLKDQVEGNVLPSELGLELDEIERLLELLGRDDNKRLVYRRKVGSILDLAKGLVLWLKPYRLSVKEAQAFLHKIVEERKEKERLRLQKKRRRTMVNVEQTLNLEEIEYPKQLSPNDIALAFEAARKRFGEPTREQSSPNKAAANRSQQIFLALEQLKKEEATRFARHIATMQRHHLERKDHGTLSESDAPQQEALEQYGLDDTEIERIRNLQGFGKQLPRNLTDEAGEMVETNVEAAAKVVKQWIGNVQQDEIYPKSGRR